MKTMVVIIVLLFLKSFRNIYLLIVYVVVVDLNTNFTGDCKEKIIAGQPRVLDSVENKYFSRLFAKNT